MPLTRPAALAGPARGRRLASGLLIAALAALALGAVACGPGGDSPRPTVYPDASRRVATLPDPTWRVAPSLTEQIVRSSTIVRATLQSATAAVVAEPDDGGYRPVQELRFTTHEYLKASGPATLLVAVRGGATYATEAGARAAADFAIAGRVTTWDARQGVLFLRTAHPTYAPVGTGATETTEAAGALAFMLSNPNQSSWAYSVDTLSRAWLPAQDTPAEGEAPTAFITDGAPTPPPTITLVELRAQIASLVAELTTGANTPGFERCIHGRIAHDRHRRAAPWTATQRSIPLVSGSSAGTNVNSQLAADTAKHKLHYWLTGPDAALFQIVNEDARMLANARPLPTGEYRLYQHLQLEVDFPCRHLPMDSYTDITLQVTAPAGTVHEAFFDPAALGGGVVGRNAAQGVLAPAAVGTAGGAAGSGATGTTSATLRRLTWDAGQLRLDVSGTTLAGQQLELIRLDGTVGLTLRGDAATRTATAGGHELRWPVCTQPWQPGERLMLRISLAPAGDPPAAPACPGAPALPTVTVDTAAPAAGVAATLAATVPADAGAATYQWQRDVGGVWTPVGAVGATYPARALTAMTGTWRVQARYASGALAHSAPVTLTWPAPATPVCTNGVTVHNPTANPGLVQDCQALLAARDALAGPGRLNWDGTRALGAWTGVAVGGTPERVTALRLGAQDLTGPLPAALGQLTQLTALDLRGNALTGDVPDALGTLTRLTALHLAGTRLTGCLPAALAGVATTDAAAQGLAACQAGPAFDAPRYDWIVPAGLPVGAAIGQVQAVDPDGGSVSYAITTGNDAVVFQLDATTGILSVAAALPAAGASLEVTATDARGGIGRVPVAVAVADAAQQRAPPLFPAGGWTFHVPENAAVGTVVGTAAARDLDGGPLTYALTAGNTGGAFALDDTSGALTVAGALDHATTATHSLTLTASDAHGGMATTTVTVTVTDVPPPPVFGAPSYSFTVAEDSAVGTQLGTIRATVAGGAAVTHALTAGNTDDRWTIDATTGELKVAGTLDYETTPSYLLMVEARSGPAAAAAVPVTITVTNVDEPPVFGADSYAFAVAEDAAPNAAVGTVTATDPEGGAVVYDITAGDAANQWAVDALAGHLVLGSRLDYETTPAYTLTVRAGVLGGSRLTATTTVTVTVTDVADAPPAPANLAATPAATSLALSWDAVTGATTYQVDYRAAEAEPWTTAADDITESSVTVADLTCATAYEVRVRAYGSGAGYTGTWSAPSAALAATTATCPPPAFGAESYAFSVAENSAAGTAVGTITATTTGSGVVRYALTAGNEAGAWAIDAGTGAMTVAGVLDYETTASHALTVTADDGQGGTSTAAVTLTVTNVDEAPGFGAADYAFSVAEDAATGAAVGTVSATDPEDGTLTYAITAGNETGAFAIDAGTGALTVAGPLDYETADEYHLTVTASDAAGQTATADIEITVTDVAFPPVFAAASYAWAVAEDAAVGAALGTVSATDPEGGAVRYKITAGNDAGALAIDAASGALTVAGALDYETTPSYDLTVEATSGGGTATATATVPVTITVTNVDEAPVFGAASYAFSVAEDAALGTTIGTVTATDPEGGTVVYDITAGNAALTWAVDALKGSVVVGARLNQAATPSYRLTVRAGSLEGGPSATTTVTITVTGAG